MPVKLSEITPTSTLSKPNIYKISLQAKMLRQNLTAFIVTQPRIKLNG